MRATEFIHFLNNDVIDDELYTHIEIRNLENGKLKESYKKIRKNIEKMLE